MWHTKFLGGPGSGWHAEQGHVPGSQGGKGRITGMDIQDGDIKSITVHEKDTGHTYQKDDKGGWSHAFVTKQIRDEYGDETQDFETSKGSGPVKDKALLERLGAVTAKSHGKSFGEEGAKSEEDFHSSKAHGTPVLKSKLGQIEVVKKKNADGTERTEYLARGRNSQSRGTFKKIESAKQALRAPSEENKSNFISGHLAPDVKWKQLEAHMPNELRELHLVGATGKVRTAIYNGREHYVVPVVALMEGVIHAVNAGTPEFVSATRLAAAAHSWNGRPLVVQHPMRNGTQISANDPVVLTAQGFGTIFESRLNGKKLGMDAYVDPLRLEALGHHDLLAKIKNGEPIEVSVGAFVRTLQKNGMYNGKQYDYEWTDITGDHLAFLPGGRGACSIEMGCGAHRAASYRVLSDRLVALGGKGSGWHAEDGHVAGSQGGGKSSGGSKTYASEAGAAYRKMAKAEKDPKQKALYEAEALRMDKAAAKHTEAAAALKPKKSLDEKFKARAKGLREARREAGGAQGKAQRKKDSAMAKGRATQKTIRAIKKRNLSAAVSDFTRHIARILGGPGSGWHASAGHVPGSQGGGGGGGGKGGGGGDDDDDDDNGAQLDKEHYPSAIDALELSDSPESDYDDEDRAANRSALKKLKEGDTNLTEKERDILADALDSALIEASDDGEEEEAQNYAAALTKLKGGGDMGGRGRGPGEKGEREPGEPDDDEPDIVRNSEDDDDSDSPTSDDDDEGGRGRAPGKNKQGGSISARDKRDLVEDIENVDLEPVGPFYSSGNKTAVEIEGGGFYVRESGGDDAEYVEKLPDDFKKESASKGKKMKGAAARVRRARALAEKYEDCPMCDGSGSKDGNPCEACEGEGQIKKMKAAAATCVCGGHRSAEDGGEDMTRIERIKTLLQNGHNPIKSFKALEASTDTDLTALEALCVEKEAAIKALADKPKEPLTEEQYLAQAPESIRTLIAEKKAQDTLRKTELVTVLKDAQSVYNEERLNAMTITALEDIAALVNVPKPDFSGSRIVPRAAAGDIYANPPNPYGEEAIAKHRASMVS